VLVHVGSPEIALIGVTLGYASISIVRHRSLPGLW